MVNQDKPKILISAYACEPNKGSEIGVGWNWVLEISKEFNVWVITRNNNKEVIEEWLNKNPNYNIKFLYYDLPKKLMFWKKGMRGVRIYYCLWQFGINKLIKKTMEKNKIKNFHHLTYGNALLPIPKLNNVKYIWGPIGGVEIIEKEFSKHYNLRERVIEFIRRSMVKFIFFNIFFHQKCKMADLILCKTSAMYDNIPIKYKDKAIHCTDVGVDLDHKILDKKQNDKKNSIIKYLTTGRLDAWRGFDLLIEAFEVAAKKNPNIKLYIVGNGSDKKRLEKMIEKANMNEYISLEGQVSIEEYRKKMKESDVVINSCLKEGGVTTSFDSVTFSKPLICIDTGGYTKNFSNGSAIIIERKSRDYIIQKLSEAILNLTDKILRKEMIDLIEETKENISWNNKGSEIRQVIREVLMHG